MWGFYVSSDIILYPPRRKAMNVLNIPKQSDRPLIYSSHAQERSFDKDIPQPKYVPLNAKLVDRQWNVDEECFSYKLEFVFNDRDYILVVSEDWRVITMMRETHFWQHRTKESSRHKKMVDKLKKHPKPYKRRQKYNHTFDCDEYNYA